MEISNFCIHIEMDSCLISNFADFDHIEDFTFVFESIVSFLDQKQVKCYRFSHAPLDLARNGNTFLSVHYVVLFLKQTNKYFISASKAI